MTPEEEALLSRSFTTTIETVQMGKKGYTITPIIVGGDYVAIAPIATQKANSIITLDTESTIGIVIGLGPLVDEKISSVFPIGSAVKFAPKPVICDLSGVYEAYGKTQVLLMRFNNILAKLQGVQVCVSEAVK
ncbi:MAG: hypothetical protein M0R50_08815 [Candidatus Cloacimonetes bacterium]|jgi:hypothetical protein|nr:hypothetical protein [Candidatus Cloacimonadota bacterium]